MLRCVSCPRLFVQATGESVDEEPEDSSPVSPEQLKDHYREKLHHLQEKLKVSVCLSLPQSLIYVIVLYFLSFLFLVGAPGRDRSVAATTC